MELLDWLWLPFVPILLLLFHQASQSESIRLQRITLTLLAITVAGWTLVNTQTAYTNSVAPRPFDFQLYWIYGSAIYDGHSPYDVSALQQAAATLEPCAAMDAELLFLQTPPSALLYAPLGAFDIQTACVLWYLVQAVVLVGAVVLLSKTFLSRDGLLGMALCAVLTLSLPATCETIWVAQTNFLILLGLVLFWRSRRHVTGGFWLATAILIKPILVLFPVYLLLRRQWKELSGVVLTGAALSALTIGILGPGMFFQYFFDNPIAHQMPASLYSEGINQSLLATVLRTLGTEIDSGHAGIGLAFAIPAVVLTVISGWLIHTRTRNDDELSLAIVLTLSLLLFPKTLSHYSVLLIVPLLFLWSRRESVPGGAIATGCLITAVFALCATDLAFVANLCSWSFVCVTAHRARSTVTVADSIPQPESIRGVALAGPGV